MSHEHETHGHGEGHSATDAPPYFSEQEWSEFHRDDVQVGKAVIMLVAGIFSVGVFLYTLIAILVASS